MSGDSSAKRLQAIVTAVCLGAVLLVPGTYGDPELPAVAPGQRLEQAAEFQLTDLHGVRVRLSETDAPVVVLHFWTTYRDCKYDLELLQRLHAKYAQRDIRVVGLAYNSGTRDDLTKFVADLGIEFPTLMCTSEVRNSYDVTTFPTTFLLNRDNEIRYWKYGHLVERHWDQLIAELIEEQVNN